MTCPNGECKQCGRHDTGNVVLHGYSKVKGGRRRRYRCTACGKTFGARTGTAYERLQHSMRRFDRVVALSVEGVNKSAIARLEASPVTRSLAGWSWPQQSPAASTRSTCAVTNSLSSSSTR